MIVPRDSPVHAHVVSFVSWVFGSNPDRFPGCQPISIERRHFRTLTSNDYVVTEKTDGLRQFVVACRIGQQRKVFMVNRAYDIVEIPLRLGPKAYDGTILDAEFLGAHLYVFDAIYMNGAACGHLDFLSRLERMEEFMTQVISMTNDPYKLRLKQFHVFADFVRFADEYLPSVVASGVKVDGVIFIPVREHVKMGTHETMFKYKNLEKNTIDFKLEWDHTRTVWRMYLQDKGKPVYELDTPANEPWFKSGMVVECAYDAHRDAWIPQFERTDKNFPNNRRTYYRTLVNIKENLQLDDFKDLARSML